MKFLESQTIDGLRTVRLYSLPLTPKLAFYLWQPEEDATFPDLLRLLPTQPADIPRPEGQNQAKTRLSKNAIARLLLLETKQSIPLSLPLLDLQLIEP